MLRAEKRTRKEHKQAITLTNFNFFFSPYFAFVERLHKNGVVKHFFFYFHLRLQLI